MITKSSRMNLLLNVLVEKLDIPSSYYQRAKDRYESLGQWLCRPQSKVAHLRPSVYPQGSFRFGTVIMPVFTTEVYDLDLVCELLLLAKDTVSQRELKHLIGDEVKAYAIANGLKKPVEEKTRCWRLEYSDTVSFHIDALPAVPDDEHSIGAIKILLARHGVLMDLADDSVAITDRESPRYEQVHHDWPRSNPKGYAKWFEGRMRSVAKARIEELITSRVYASVDDVPAYEWKTPLQRAIQILKRHRDIMFVDNPDVKPISMVLTTLAAHGYEGETDLSDALVNIVDRMPKYMMPSRPRVPNPVNPAEDFADKWAKNPALEDNFRLWHRQIKADLDILAAGDLDANRLLRRLRDSFGVEVTGDEVDRIIGPKPAERVTAPIITVKPSAPKPWTRHA